MDIQFERKAVRLAAHFWGSDVVPDWRDSEYMRAQVELLSDLFGSPFDVYADWETVKDWYMNQIRFECSTVKPVVTKR